jgi:hypothetical protein
LGLNVWIKSFFFSIKLFSKLAIKKKLAQIDTRRRPDQRILENGDMAKESNEKERLEI